MTIYDLKLHEQLKVGVACSVARVPGGWIYHYYDPDEDDSGYPKFAVFIPYHVEFKQVPGLTINKTP
jgi:hypothetical protein